jgi:hypothetical protein
MYVSTNKKKNSYQMRKSCLWGENQGCQIFLGIINQQLGENIPNDQKLPNCHKIGLPNGRRKILDKATKYTNIFQFQGPLKYIQKILV